VFRIDEALATATLVDQGAAWQYLDDGSDQQTAWRLPEFNSDSWKSGPAELGYGDGDEQTTVDFGGVATNRHVTTYFRHEFQVDDPSQYDQLVVELLRDDGAAVYLNGNELVRTENLAPDADFQTLANLNGAPAVNGSNEDVFLTLIVPASQLRVGENVLAVEMHQHSRTSNDLSFNLRLSAVLNQAAVPGDLDGDGVLDANDINQLTLAIRTGQTDSRWDMNGDARVDADDRLTWVHDLKRTWLGDSDLNGLFEEADLVQAMQAGQYEDSVPANSLWESGDFDGDLEFTTGDLVAAFIDGGYLAGPRAAAAAVPEAGIAYALPWAMAILAAVRRYEKAARSSFRLRGMAVAKSSLPSNSSEMNPR
jgi:hypothetical protein